MSASRILFRFSPENVILLLHYLLMGFKLVFTLILEDDENLSYVQSNFGMMNFLLQ